MQGSQVQDVKNAVLQAGEDALQVLSPEAALAACDLLLSKHTVMYERRCNALLASLKETLANTTSSPQPIVPPIVFNRVLRWIHTACSTGWLLNNMDIDATLKKLESQVPNLKKPDDREERQDDVESQRTTLMIETMRNNSNLLRSDVSSNLSDEKIIEVFKGLRSESDLRLDSKILGGGSFGVVQVGSYKGKPCAVKIPKSTAAANESKREAAMLLKLNPSPHIVGIIGLCPLTIESGIATVTIMELTNESLKDRLTKSLTVASDFLTARMRALEQEQLNPQLTSSPPNFEELVHAGLMRWTTKVKIARDVILGIAYMHACGIIHGDLKPGNILLDKWDNAKLCDVGASASTNSVNVRPIAYTPGYVSNEFMQSGKVSFHNDIYAYGQVLIDIAGATAPPRLPHLIGQIANLCKTHQMPADEVAQIMVDLFVDFDDWDHDSLFLPRAKKSANLFKPDLIHQIPLDQAMKNMSLQPPHAPPPSDHAQMNVPASGPSDSFNEHFHRNYPRAYNVWLAANNGRHGATFHDILQAFYAHLPAGSQIKVDMLRSALSLSQDSDIVPPERFFSVCHTAGGFDGLVRLYVWTANPEHGQIHAADEQQKAREELQEARRLLMEYKRQLENMKAADAAASRMTVVGASGGHVSAAAPAVPLKKCRRAECGKMTSPEYNFCSKECADIVKMKEQAQQPWSQPNPVGPAPASSAYLNPVPSFNQPTSTSSSWIQPAAPSSQNSAASSVHLCKRPTCGKTISSTFVFCSKACAEAPPIAVSQVYTPTVAVPAASQTQVTSANVSGAKCKRAECSKSAPSGFIYCSKECAEALKKCNCKLCDPGRECH
ncbi:hypothetical protein HDV05_001737 [Chytridiales sp. JEL 0842]|nr:hypothetical protein HDV05_001737 [Chytridiales sp. JEL 0842]